MLLSDGIILTGTFLPLGTIAVGKYFYRYRDD